MPTTDLLRAVREDALDLVFPAWCAGCDDPGRTLCDDCRAHLRAAPTVQTLPGGIVVHSGLRFDGVAARVLRALKEDGRTPLARPLGGVLGEALRAAAAGAGGHADEITVVAVPSSRAALRRRPRCTPTSVTRSSAS